MFQKLLLLGHVGMVRRIYRLDGPNNRLPLSFGKRMGGRKTVADAFFLLVYGLGEKVPVNAC